MPRPRIACTSLVDSCDLPACCPVCLWAAPAEDFVFQPSTGLCVLLPEVAASEIVKLPNSQVVSGTVSVAMLRQETINHGECVFTPGSGYTRGEVRVDLAERAVTIMCCLRCMARLPHMRRQRFAA